MCTKRLKLCPLELTIGASLKIETRAFLEPGGAPYDAAHLAHRYAADVPIVHQSAAVSEVIAQLAIDGDDDSE